MERCQYEENEIQQLTFSSRIWVPQTLKLYLQKNLIACNTAGYIWS